MREQRLQQQQRRDGLRQKQRGKASCRLNGDGDGTPPGLLGTGAIKADGKIHTLGIAEISVAIGESVCSCRQPYRMEQVSRGFHHDGSVRSPGDNEAELVALETTSSSMVQNNRVWKQPCSRRAPSKRRAPATGSGQIIYRCIFGAGEHHRIGATAGRITPKIYTFQAGVLESTALDGGNTLGDGNACQARAEVKCTFCRW